MSETSDITMTYERRRNFGASSGRLRGIRNGRLGSWLSLHSFPTKAINAPSTVPYRNPPITNVLRRLCRAAPNFASSPAVKRMSLAMPYLRRSEFASHLGSFCKLAAEASRCPVPCRPIFKNSDAWFCKLGSGFGLFLGKIRSQVRSPGAHRRTLPARPGGVGTLEPSSPAREMVLRSGGARTSVRR